MPSVRTNILMNLLFVCSQNRLRSPTAEAVFSAYPGIKAISAGTNADSDVPVSGDLIEWADLVLVMEAGHRRKITARFGPMLRHKPLAVLGIPDRYQFMQPELIELLRVRVARLLPTPPLPAEAG